MKVKVLLNRDFFSHWGIVALHFLLVSVIQQSELNTCIHMSLLPWISSPLGHRALNGDPCAIQSVLISYLFYP